MLRARRRMERGRKSADRICDSASSGIIIGHPFGTDHEDGLVAAWAQVCRGWMCLWVKMFAIGCKNFQS
jgi:hypothetical protein